MTGIEPAVKIAFLAGLALLGCWILFRVVGFLVSGFAATFRWALMRGPVGVLVMLVLWVTAFPVMAVLALVFGIRGRDEREPPGTAERDGRDRSV